MARVIGKGRVSVDPHAAADVARLCGYLPLAVRIAAAKLATRADMSIGDLAERLAHEQYRLGELGAGDRQVRSSFLLSYEDLSSAQALMFRRLGLVAGADFSREVAAVLAGTGPQEAEALLEALVDAHLVEAGPTPGRYRFHDLLRLYARERVQAEEDDRDRDSVLRRMLEWYLATAQTAGRILDLGRRGLGQNRAGKESEPVLATRAEALKWYEAERANLMAAIRQAADCGFHALAWQLPDALWIFFHIRYHMADLEESHQVGLAAARRAHDRKAEAWMLCSLGEARRALKSYEEAIDYYEQSRMIFQEIGDRSGEGRALNRLGEAFDELRRYEKAIELCKQALSIFREIGRNRWQEGWILYNLGEAYQGLHCFEESISYLKGALGIRQEIGDRWGESWTLYSLGMAYRRQHCFEESIDYYERHLRSSERSDPCTAGV